MPTTPRLLLPYPAFSDAPSGPPAFQALAEAVEAQLSGLPRGQIITGGSAQSVASNTVTDVTFSGGAITYNTDVTASLAAGSLTINEAGLYIVTASLVYASNATGYRALLIYNSTVPEYVEQHYGPPSNGTVTTARIVTEPISLPAGTVLKLRTVQTSGAGLALASTNGRPTASLAAHWVGGQ